MHVLFGLKFADDIHYNSNQGSKARLQISKHTGAKQNLIIAKWRFKVIQSHVFWSQRKGDKALVTYFYLLSFRRHTVYERSAVNFRGLSKVSK